MKFRRSSKAPSSPLVETLEGRCLFATVGPSFQTPLADAYWVENTPATAATLSQFCQSVKIMPQAIAGGLEFRAATGWDGSSFSLAISSGEALGVTVTGPDVAVTIAAGDTPSHWQDVVDALNANTDFQNLHVTTSLSGSDAEATALNQTTLTPWGSGLKLTALTGAKAVSITIVAATGDTPTAGVNVAGTDVTVSIVAGTTTWQNVVDMLNANTSFQGLKMAASLAGPQAQPGPGSALAVLNDKVTLNSGLDWTAPAGADGNGFSVTIVNGTDLGVAVTGKDVVITLNSGFSTLQDVIDKLNATTAFADLHVQVALKGGNVLAAAASKTSFSGGKDKPLWTRIIGIDGTEITSTSGKTSSAASLIISAVSDNPNLIVDVPTGTIDPVTGVIHQSDPYAKLDFYGGSSYTNAKSMGSIIFQLFQNSDSATAVERFIELATESVSAPAATWQYKPDATKLDGILFTARQGGLEGNSYTVAIQTGAVSGTDACTVAITGNDVVVTIKATTKLQDIVTKVNGLVGGSYLPIKAQLQGSSVTAVDAAETNHLSGGQVGSLVPGTPFYNWVFVHRVIPGFMVQMGDAVLGNYQGLAGTGGSGLPAFNDVFDPNLGFGGEGQLAMANSGPNTNDSQFFITEFDSSDTLNQVGTDPTAAGYKASTWPTTWLDGKHMIFGQMISGQSVLQSVANAPSDTSSYTFADGSIIANPNYNRPTGLLYLQSVEIIHSVQDGSIMLTALDGFTGSAHVTITLQDAKGRTVQKVITVEPKSKLAAEPTVNDLTGQPQTTTPGGHVIVNGVGTVNTSFLAKYGVTSTDDLIHPQVDAAGNVTVDIPQSYSGIFTVSETVTDGTVSDDPAFANLAFAEWKQASTSFRVFALRSTENWGGTGDNANAVTVFNHRLYEALGSYGLKIYDITDYTHPSLVGSYQLLNTDDTPQTNTDGSPKLQYRDIKVVEQVVNGQTITVAYATNQQGGVDVLDVSDPATAVTKLSNFNSSSSAYSIATILHEVGGVMYAVVPGLNELTIYNVSDPSHPDAGAHVAVGYPGLNFTDVANVVFKDNVMYVADLTGVIYMYTMTDMTKPKLLNLIVTQGNPWGMDFQGNRLFVADLVKGLLVYDVSNVHAPRLVGKYKTATEAYDVQVRNQEAFVFTAGGTISLLINDIRHITPEDTFSCAGSASPAFDGNTLVLPVGSGYTSMDVTSMLNRRVATSVSTTFTDANGHLVTVSGVNVRVNVVTSGEGGGSIQKIDVIPLKANGSVKITVADGFHTTASEVAVQGLLGLRTFSGASVNLDGDFTVYDGPISSITLGDVLAGGTLTVNGTGKGFSFTAGNVTDFNIHSDSTPIKSINVASWIDSAYNEATPDIRTIGIGKITSKGDFDPDMKLTGYNSTTKTALGNVSIAGYLQNALWDVTGAIGNITATLGVKNARVQSTGNMGSLSLGSAEAVDFLAGITPANSIDRHATAADQFNALVSIRGITIKGFRGQAIDQDLFINSNFSSAKIGATTLLNAQTTALAGDFGLFALQNTKKNQLPSVKIGHYGSRVYTTIYSSSKQPANYRDGQLVVESLI